MTQYQSQGRGRHMSHLSEEQLDGLIDQERTRQHTPLNDWRTIAARAREEGLIRASEQGSGGLGQPWLRAAAAVLLLVGGVAIGRSSASVFTFPDGDQRANQVITSPPLTASNLTPDSRIGGASFASVDEASATLE